MASTLALNSVTWDLQTDVNGNIAVASGAAALAQDAASAIKTFLGEVWWDTTVGVRWMQSILARNPPLSVLKQQLVDAALTVSGIVSARVFISSFSGRVVSGQVQIVSSTGQAAAANFSVVNPQGT